MITNVSFGVRLGLEPGCELGAKRFRGALSLGLRLQVKNRTPCNYEWNYFFRPVARFLQGIEGVGVSKCLRPELYSAAQVFQPSDAKRVPSDNLREFVRVGCVWLFCGHFHFKNTNAAKSGQPGKNPEVRVMKVVRVIGPFGIVGSIYNNQEIRLMGPSEAKREVVDAALDRARKLAIDVSNCQPQHCRGGP